MDKNTPGNSKTSWWKKILLVILGFFLSLILIETGLRLGGFIILSLQEQRNIASARQKGTYLIMCLGESTTADGPNPYPDQLENILNQYDIGIRFVVVNKGVPTINTKHILKYLPNNLGKYHPDMVVTMMGINDKYVKYYEGVQDANTKLFNTFKTYKFARLIQKNILEKSKRQDFDKVKVGVRPDTQPSCDSVPRKATAVHNGLGWTGIVRGWFHKKGEKSIPAEKTYQEAIKLNPRNTDAYAALGWLYMRERKYPQAKEMFQQAANLNSSNSRAYFGLGVLYQSSGEYTQAKKAFEKAISLDPGDDTSRVSLGWIYMCTNDFTRAQELLKAGIQFHPKSDKLYRALIELYRQAGDNRSAAEYSMLKSKLGLSDDSSTDLTRRNYLELKKILDQRKIRLVCVQYPVRALRPLKEIFDGQEDGVLFVDNEKTFKDALQQASYSEYFIDMFAGDFGHCTAKGNHLIAQNIADLILKEVFHR